MPRVGPSVPSLPLGHDVLCFLQTKRWIFSAVVNAALHSKSLIVELLCITPPFLPLDSSNLIILPSFTSHVLPFFPFLFLGFLLLITGDPLQEGSLLTREEWLPVKHWELIFCLVKCL